MVEVLADAEQGEHVLGLPGVDVGDDGPFEAGVGESFDGLDRPRFVRSVALVARSRRSRQLSGGSPSNGAAVAFR